jgi:RHS repeat-associated protein
VATSSGRYCYHFNATGSTVALTDVNQNVVNSYAYDPFGTVLNQQETVPQPFKYVGQYGVMAEPNRLYYMRARYYDPNVGRFISEDPLGFAGGDVNLFAYVQNSPVNRFDPWGLIWVTTGESYNTGWNIFNTLFGNGMKPIFPGSNDFVGDKRTVTQQWQQDPDNPCRDSEYPLGTTRQVPQVYSQMWLGPDDLTSDPNVLFIYQWYPWVNDNTYDYIPNALYQYPWDKGR